MHTVTLPLTGGNGVVTYMAANNNYLFIGTSQSLEAVEVRKSNLSASKLGIISGDITSITSDQYGYVTVAQSSGFDVYGPDGSLEEDGGGSQFMLGTTQAVPASFILVGDFVQNPHFHMKTNAPSTQGPN